MHHNLEYWDDKSYEKVLWSEIYQDVSNEHIKKLDTVSEKAKRSHIENELHKYGNIMNYFIKNKKYSARKARDETQSFARLNGFLPAFSSY